MVAVTLVVLASACFWCVAIVGVGAWLAQKGYLWLALGILFGLGLLYTWRTK